MGRGWLAYGVAVTAATVGYFMLPTSAQSHLYDLIGVSAVVAMLMGVRRHQPTFRTGYLLLTFGVASLAAGNFLFGTSQPVPSPADMLYISAYPLLALGLVSLVPRWGRRHGDLFVSLAITATVGLLCWSFLIVPAGGTRGVTFATRLVAIGYPLMDTCLLAVLMTAMVSQGRRNPSTRCLGIGLLLLLIADVGYACQNFGTAYALGAAPDAAWLLSYAAFGAALLHPSLRDEPVQPPAPAAVSTTSPAADRRSTTVVLVRPALGTLHIETVAFLSGWFLLALATMTVALSAMWLTSDLVLVAGAYGVTGLVMVCAGSKYHHAR